MPPKRSVGEGLPSAHFFDNVSFVCLEWHGKVVRGTLGLHNGCLVGLILVVRISLPSLGVQTKSCEQELITQWWPALTGIVQAQVFREWGYF